MAQELAVAAGPDVWSRVSAPTPTFLKSSDGLEHNPAMEWSGTSYKRHFKGADLVINIQDAHANLSAQKSIVKSLDEFDAAYNIELIGIEGSEGRIDTSLVDSISDQRVREDIAEGLLGKTMISAAEYRRIVQGGGPELYGVEDAALYRRNIKDYRRLLTMRETARTNMQRLRYWIESMEQSALPDEVRKLHVLSGEHTAGRVPFGEYWGRLYRDGLTAGIQPAATSGIAMLTRALDLEKTIDFKTASLQREETITSLKTVLPGSERARFFKELVLFKTGKLSAAEVHRKLLERVEKYLPQMQVGELRRYSEYLRLYRRIDLTALFEEVRDFEQQTIKAMLKEPEQQLAYDRIETLDLLDRLLDGEMTPADLARYRVARNMSGLGALRALDASDKYVDWKSLERAERIARGFYARVEARNRAMLARLVERMHIKGVRTAALVTGGFHSEGLSSLMEQERISHVVVLPGFDAAGPQRPYAAVITSKGSYLDRNIRNAALAEVIALALWSASVQGLSIPRAKAMLERSADRISNRTNTGRHSGKESADSKQLVSPDKPGLKSPGGRAGDSWIATGSVLGEIDGGLAADMARGAVVIGDRIWVGGNEFRGSKQIISTATGTRRYRSSVLWTGWGAPPEEKTPPITAAPVSSESADLTAAVSDTSYKDALRETREKLGAYLGRVLTAQELEAEFDQLWMRNLRKRRLDPGQIPADVIQQIGPARTRSVQSALAQASARLAAEPPHRQSLKQTDSREREVQMAIEETVFESVHPVGDGHYRPRYIDYAVEKPAGEIRREKEKLFASAGARMALAAAINLPELLSPELMMAAIVIVVGSMIIRRLLGPANKASTVANRLPARPSATPEPSSRNASPAQGRPVLRILAIGTCLAIVTTTIEKVFFSKTTINPSTAKYEPLAGPSPLDVKPWGKVKANGFEREAADAAMRAWIESKSTVRQKVHEQLSALNAAEASVASAESMLAVIEAEAQSILAERAAVEGDLAALESKRVKQRTALEARMQDVERAAGTLTELNKILIERRTSARAMLENDPGIAEKKADILRVRAEAQALRARAAEAEQASNTSAGVTQEYVNGGKFLRRLGESLSFGFKGPIPEISVSPFAGKTQRKVGEVQSRGQEAEAAVRAYGSREQADILEYAAAAQEAALAAYKAGRSVTTEDALDPEIAGIVVNIHNIEREVTGSQELLDGLKADAQALTSEESAWIAKQTDLSARERARGERAEAARSQLAAARALVITQSEQLIVQAGLAIHAPGSPVFFPELAGAFLEVGAQQADPRLLPFAADLLIYFESLFSDAMSNPAQRDAAQVLADQIRRYIEVQMTSSDPRNSVAARELLEDLRGQMRRENKLRPLSATVTDQLLSAVPSGAVPGTLPAAQSAPVLLTDPGLDELTVLADVEHAEEAAQIAAALEPIVSELDSRERIVIEAAFQSGSLRPVLELANSSNVALAIGAVRQMSVQPGFGSLLFEIARDLNVSPKIRGAAIEGIAAQKNAKDQRLPDQDPVLMLLDDLIPHAPGRDQINSGNDQANMIVLTRLARLAGTLNPAQALPYLERILNTTYPPAVYAAATELRLQASSPDAVGPLLETLARGPFAYNPNARQRIQARTNLWSDRSAAQDLMIQTVFELCGKYADEPSLKVAINGQRQNAIKERRMGFVEFVLDPARQFAEPNRSISIEDRWSQTTIWFYNRFEMFTMLVLFGFGSSILFAIGRRVRREVEGVRPVPSVRGYDDPHRPDRGASAARLASLDLQDEAENILLRSLEDRFGPTFAERVRSRLNGIEFPRDSAGWMRLFPGEGSQILSELDNIRINPIDLIEFRIRAWERVLDSDGFLSPAEMSGSIFALLHQLMIRLPRRFDYQNFYKKLDDRRDGVINIRTVARTVKVLQKIDELLRREWKLTLSGHTSVLDRDLRTWSMMSLQRQYMRTYRAFGAAQELFELANVAQTYNDYRMHPILMRLFVFEAMKRKGIQLLAQGPRDPSRPHLRGVLDDYYRAIGRPVSVADVERDVLSYFEEYSDHYLGDIQKAQEEGNYVAVARIVGRRYRRLIAVLMPAFGIAAGFLLGGPVFGLPALLRAVFLGSLGILASRWTHHESFYRPLLLNYDHYVSTVVDMLEERNRLFATKFHISEFADGRDAGTYIESDDFVRKMLLNSTKERRRKVVQEAAAERPVDLLMVMAGGGDSEAWRSVQHRVLNHELINGKDTPVVFIPDDPDARGSFRTFLKAHSFLAGGPSTAEVVQSMMNESWFVRLNTHLIDASGKWIRPEVRERLIRDHYRRIRSGHDPARVGVLYAGGDAIQQGRVAEYADEALVRLHAGLLWAKRSGAFVVANEYADGQYAGPLPFYDHDAMSDLRAGEVLVPLTWATSEQVERERSAIYLPDPSGMNVAEVIPGGLDTHSRRRMMDRAWMNSTSPFTKFQLDSPTPQFLTDTGEFLFSPNEGMLQEIKALRQRAISEARGDGGDAAGGTLERFFRERGMTRGDLRIRAVISPPDATRYQQTDLGARVRRDSVKTSENYPGLATSGPALPAPELKLGSSDPVPSVTTVSSAADLEKRVPAPVLPVPHKWDLAVLLSGRIRLTEDGGPGRVIKLTPQSDGIYRGSSAEQNNIYGALSGGEFRLYEDGVFLGAAAVSGAELKLIVMPSPDSRPAFLEPPYQIVINSEGAPILSQPGALINGYPVVMKRAAKGVGYECDVKGSGYRLEWRDAAKSALLLSRDGAPQVIEALDPHDMDALRSMLPSGARMTMIINVPADNYESYQTRMLEIQKELGRSQLMRQIDFKWALGVAKDPRDILTERSNHDRLFLDESAFEGNRLRDPEAVAEAIRAAGNPEMRLLKTLLELMERTTDREQYLTGPAVDAWLDLVTAPGILPAVEPVQFVVRNSGYFYAPANDNSRLSVDGAARMLDQALTGSTSVAQARLRAREAVRAMTEALWSAARSGSAGRLQSARTLTRDALLRLNEMTRKSLIRRSSLPPGMQAVRGEDEGRILIEEALYLEFHKYFNEESAALQKQLEKAGRTIRPWVAVELTEALKGMSVQEREQAYRTDKSIPDTIGILFLDSSDRESGIYSADLEHQALLTQMASELANLDWPQNVSVIEAQAGDGIPCVGMLFTAARLLIEHSDHLPGMKKITDGRYFYLPPLTAGALLRTIVGARLAERASRAAA